jgi:Flp pilus assembly secretin CpaC
VISDGKNQRKRYEKRYPTSVCIHNGESMIMNGDGVREMKKKSFCEFKWLGTGLWVEKHGGVGVQ